MQAGEAKTAEDYDRAAFIFQHGGKPNDYLLAHLLGMTAMALDAGPGRFIATATLDRYLKSTGKPQIFGNDLAPNTESDWNLIPEPVRAANCVPSRAEHERILEAIAKNTLPESMGRCQPKGDCSREDARWESGPGRDRFAVEGRRSIGDSRDERPQDRVEGTVDCRPGTKVSNRRAGVSLEGPRGHNERLVLWAWRIHWSTRRSEATPGRKPPAWWTTARSNGPQTTQKHRVTVDSHCGERRATSIC